MKNYDERVHSSSYRTVLDSHIKLYSKYENPIFPFLSKRKDFISSHQDHFRLLGNIYLLLPPLVSTCQHIPFVFYENTGLQNTTFMKRCIWIDCFRDSFEIFLFHDLIKSKKTKSDQALPTTMTKFATFSCLMALLATNANAFAPSLPRRVSNMEWLNLFHSFLDESKSLFLLYTTLYL